MNLQRRLWDSLIWYSKKSYKKSDSIKDKFQGKINKTKDRERKKSLSYDHFISIFFNLFFQ